MLTGNYVIKHKFDCLDAVKNISFRQDTPEFNKIAKRSNLYTSIRPIRLSKVKIPNEARSKYFIPLTIVKMFDTRHA